MVRPCFITKSNPYIYLTTAIPVIRNISFRASSNVAFKCKSHCRGNQSGRHLRHGVSQYRASLSRHQFGFRCFPGRKCFGPRRRFATSGASLRSWRQCGQPIYADGRPATGPGSGSTESVPDHVDVAIRVVVIPATFLCAAGPAAGVLSTFRESVL